MKKNSKILLKAAIVTLLLTAVLAGRYAWYEWVRSYVYLHHFPEISSTYRKVTEKFRSEKSEQFDVVVIGDSIPGRCTWSANVKNRGLDGDTVLGVTKRLKEVDRFSPKVLLISVGANDLLYGLTVKKVTRNFEILLQRARQLQSNPKIWIQSILPENNEMIPSAISFNSQAKKLNRNLAKISLHTARTTHQNFLPDMEMPKSYTTDGEHLSQLGCKTWNEWVARELNSMGTPFSENKQ